MRDEKDGNTFATCQRAKACGGQSVVRPDGKGSGVNRRYGHFLAENIEAPETPLSVFASQPYDVRNLCSMLGLHDTLCCYRLEAAGPRPCDWELGADTTFPPLTMIYLGILLQQQEADTYSLFIARQTCSAKPSYRLLLSMLFILFFILSIFVLPLRM